MFSSTLSLPLGRPWLGNDHDGPTTLAFLLLDFQRKFLNMAWNVPCPGQRGKEQPLRVEGYSSEHLLVLFA
jgi:hypothetical protein